MMNYDEFLTAVIERGIKGAKLDYEKKPSKLKGAVDGFTACRGKDPAMLKELLRRARQYTNGAKVSRRTKDAVTSDRYWEIRCFELEVEWVCNCVSVLLMNNGGDGKDVIVPPTARAVIAVADIVGVREGKSLN